MQRNVLEIGAEHEVRSGLESEQPPHERFALTLGGDVVEQAIGTGPGDLERHEPPLLAEFGRPAAGKRLPELFAMISVKFGGVGREASETGVRHDLGVELAIRRGSDGIEPIHGRGSPLIERPVEEVRGRSVLQDFRAVLAAQQIDVIDPEIGWDLLVGGWLVGAFPLHRPGGRPRRPSVERAKRCPLAQATRNTSA